MWDQVDKLSSLVPAQHNPLFPLALPLARTGLSMGRQKQQHNPGLSRAPVWVRERQWGQHHWQRRQHRAVCGLARCSWHLHMQPTSMAAAPRAHAEQAANLPCTVLRDRGPKGRRVSRTEREA